MIVSAQESFSYKKKISFSNISHCESHMKAQEKHSLSTAASGGKQPTVAAAPLTTHLSGWKLSWQPRRSWRGREGGRGGVRY